MDNYIVIHQSANATVLDFELLPTGTKFINAAIHHHTHKTVDPPEGGSIHYRGKYEAFKINI